MTAPAAAPSLHVLTPATVERWQALVTDVAHLVDLESVVEPWSVRTRTDAGQAILESAAERDGPVLILPEGRAQQAAGSTGGIRRVLVPFDRSPGERQTLRRLIERAHSRGMEVEQVHVLSRASGPAIWDGAGHHAEAWLEELQRRHRVGPSILTVRSGVPATVLAALAGGSDLLVACWSGQAAATRARVIRELLSGPWGTPSPVLLLRPSRLGQPPGGH